jgi:FkbM family methyltransferase
MRIELLYNPRLLCERLAELSLGRRRLAHLRGTCAHWLTRDHIDSLELIELTAADGARVFYDIGASVGSWTLLTRALVPDSVIIAFEPMAEHVDAFRANTRGLPDIDLFAIALGGREETRPFYPASFSDASSFLPLTEEGKAQWKITNRPTEPLSLTTLDKLVRTKSLPAPDVLKLDVQGFELEVLRGAEQTLPSARWVISEVCFREFYEGQASFSELVRFLGRHNFEVSAIGHTMRAGQMLDTGDVLFHRVDGNPHG